MRMAILACAAAHFRRGVAIAILLLAVVSVRLGIVVVFAGGFCWRHDGGEWDEGGSSGGCSCGCKYGTRGERLFED